LEKLLEHPLWGLLANPFGKTARSASLDGKYLRLVGNRRESTVPLEDVSGPPTIRRGLLGTALTISVAGSEDTVVRGVTFRDASGFRDRLENAWIEFNLAALERHGQVVDRLREELDELMDQPSRYPAACVIDPLLADIRELDVSLLSKLHPSAIGADAVALIAPLRSFAAEPDPVRTSAKAEFVAAELEQYAGFFDTIESNPLTPEQRLAVVVDEDATLVLAGAGSGKTSVITAKAAYLVKAGICAPEDILLLAFAKNAAKEMSERVEKRSGVPITARTFHALAYDIIGQVEGSKPALAEHATDDLAFSNLIKAILKDLVSQDPEVSKAIIRWFAHFLVEPKSEWDFKTKHQFYSHLEKHDLRTLQGEKVKSYEELQIANWLYENGIEYEYEPEYEHKIAGTGKRDYCPDFRLTASGIYIEHFGVRRERNSDGTERLVTAPFVKREPYLAGMEWKRKVHAEHGTTLIETYSYERQEGRLLSSVESKLAPHVVLEPRAVNDVFDRIIELHQVDSFSQLLGTFLRKFKSGGYDLEACHARVRTLSMGERARAFLSVFAPVFARYQDRLGGRIDFEDMVLRAAHYVETGRYVSRFTRILVDEFQDISQGRARLVKALKEQNSDTRIFAVGDDWQSIFRFAGSDIHLMRHFGEEFGGSFGSETGIHGVIDLGRTFRSVDQIAYAAKDFILRNPAQIAKRIVPAGAAPGPAIGIVFTSKSDQGEKLLQVLAGLAAKSSEKPASILLLARYRFLEPDMPTLRRRFPGLRISFKTIHSAKGLEADHVILLNADRGRMGFPSEIVDDPLLSLVSPEAEVFENAEERRVMYVAMTRARHTLTIMASELHPSSFVEEIKANQKSIVALATRAEPRDYECGECGGRLLKIVGHGRRVRYRCEHSGYCENVLPACSACGTGLPIRPPGSAVAQCGCGAAFQLCPDPECNHGWLVPRSGRFGNFLGCVRYPTCSGSIRLPKDSGASLRGGQPQIPDQ
jgi:DNA helicase-4